MNINLNSSLNLSNNKNNISSYNGFNSNNGFYADNMLKSLSLNKNKGFIYDNISLVDNILKVEDRCIDVEETFHVDYKGNYDYYDPYIAIKGKNINNVSVGSYIDFDDYQILVSRLEPLNKSIIIFKDNLSNHAKVFLDTEYLHDIDILLQDQLTINSKVEKVDNRYIIQIMNTYWKGSNQIQYETYEFIESDNQLVDWFPPFEDTNRRYRFKLKINDYVYTSIQNLEYDNPIFKIWNEDHWSYTRQYKFIKESNPTDYDCIDSILVDDLSDVFDVTEPTVLGIDSTNMLEVYALDGYVQGMNLFKQFGDSELPFNGVFGHSDFGQQGHALNRTFGLYPKYDRTDLKINVKWDPYHNYKVYWKKDNTAELLSCKGLNTYCLDTEFGILANDILYFNKQVYGIYRNDSLLLSLLDFDSIYRFGTDIYYKTKDGIYKLNINDIIELKSNPEIRTNIVGKQYITKDIIPFTNAPLNYKANQYSGPLQSVSVNVEYLDTYQTITQARSHSSEMQQDNKDYRVYTMYEVTPYNEYNTDLINFLTFTDISTDIAQSSSDISFHIPPVSINYFSFPNIDRVWVMRYHSDPPVHYTISYYDSGNYIRQIFDGTKEFINIDTDYTVDLYKRNSEDGYLQYYRTYGSKVTAEKNKVDTLYLYDSLEAPLTFIETVTNNTSYNLAETNDGMSNLVDKWVLLSTSYLELSDLFIINSQEYKVKDGFIYYENEPIIEVHGLDLLYVTPSEAIFISKFDNKLYEFTGARTLTYFSDATSLSSIKFNKYISGCQLPMVITDEYVYIGNSRLNIRNVIDYKVLDDIIYIYTSDYTYEIKCCNDNQIEFSTCYYGNGETETTVVNYFFTLYSPKQCSGQLQLSTSTINQITETSRVKTIDIKRSDWNDNYCYVKYTPELNKGFGVALNCISDFSICNIRVELLEKDNQRGSKVNG